MLKSMSFGPPALLRCHADINRALKWSPVERIWRDSEPITVQATVSIRKMR